MAQPKELRRFEIDAIAHRIAEDVKTSKTKAHQKLRKTGAYKRLRRQQKNTQVLMKLSKSLKPKGARLLIRLTQKFLNGTHKIKKNMCVLGGRNMAVAQSLISMNGL